MLNRAKAALTEIKVYFHTRPQGHKKADRQTAGPHNYIAHDIIIWIT